MPNIVIANEAVISYAESLIALGALNFFAPLVTKEWGNEDVTYGWKDNPLGKGFTRKIDWFVYITERRRRKDGAKDFDDMDPISGLPRAWSSLRAISGDLFGKYHCATVDKKGRVVGANKFIREGLVGVMAHEIAEALNETKIGNFSEADSKGRQWLIEVADPLAGSFLNWTNPA